MKYNLYIDTSHKKLNIGLSKGKEMVEVFSKEYLKQHSELLAKVVEDLLKKYSLPIKRIENVVVTNGPGSYTGIRIGLAFAKTLAYALNISCYTISTLKAIAGIKKNVIILLDAKRDRFYVGLYDFFNPEKNKELIMTKDEVLAYLKENPTIEIIDYSMVFNSIPQEINIIANMNSLMPFLKKEENIHDIKGVYL